MLVAELRLRREATSRQQEDRTGNPQIAQMTQISGRTAVGLPTHIGGICAIGEICGFVRKAPAQFGASTLPQPSTESAPTLRPASLW